MLALYEAAKVACNYDAARYRQMVLERGGLATACRVVRGRPVRGRFPAKVALHLMRRACELPDQAGRSLSQWDCVELARQLVVGDVVAAILPHRGSGGSSRATAGSHGEFGDGCCSEERDAVSIA
jgi:hypothetical protein